MTPEEVAHRETVAYLRGRADALRDARRRSHVHSEECRCLFEPCVAWWKHHHGGFPGGCEDPADPKGPPRIFDGENPDPDAVRDYNGAAL